MNKKTTVTLRTQKLKDGRESFFIETYRSGKRERRSIGVYLLPGKSREVKNANVKARFEAEAYLKAEMNNAKRYDLGYSENPDGLDVKFLAYYDKFTEEHNGNTRFTWRAARHYIKMYGKGEDFTFRVITSSWVDGFVHFLDETDTYSNYHKNSGRKTKLSANTKYTLVSCLFACIRKAYNVDKIIPEDPTRGVSKNRRIEARKEYLTEAELKSLIANRLDEGVKYRAVVFDCLTGLRWSDIKALKWSNFSDDNGRCRMQLRMKKKKNIIDYIINNEAATLLGERKGDDDLIFDGLPQQPSMTRYIRKWCNKAGIRKHITFHCFRHTFGTLLVNSGVDIYTASKLLGHTRVETTQIYAKIIDESKTKAVDSLPKVL